MLPPETKLFKLEEENHFLRNRVQELCALYEQMTSSKAWRLVEFFRSVREKIFNKNSIAKDTQQKNEIEISLIPETPLITTEEPQVSIEEKMIESQNILEELTQALAQNEKILIEEREQSKQLFEELNKSKWAAIDLLERTQVIPPECPLCQHQGDDFSILETECMFGGGKLSRHQCPECDCIFGPHKMRSMTPELLAQDYKFLYKYYAEGDTTESAIRTFNHLSPTIKGSYLDYGAGIWSKTVFTLREKGFNVFAYEPYSTEHPHNHESDALIESPDELKTRHFDGIFSTNVLEHFLDPIQALIEMRQLLKPGGRMAHATACFEYRYEYTRFHLFFFPGRSAHVLAKRAGLKIIHEENEGEYMVRVFEPLATETS